MGKRPAARQGSPLWVTTADLPTNAGHPFFERLSQVLEEAGFDAFVEGLCAVFYAARMGRPSLRPGRYFRMLLIGYFEGLSSERGIAWRVADSLSLRSFLDLDVTERSPDHSTLSRTRRLIDVVPHVTTDNDDVESRQGCGDMTIPVRSILRTVELSRISGSASSFDAAQAALSPASTTSLSAAPRHQKGEQNG